MKKVRILCSAIVAKQAALSNWTVQKVSHKAAGAHCGRQKCFCLSINAQPLGIQNTCLHVSLCQNWPIGHLLCLKSIDPCELVHLPCSSAKNQVLLAGQAASDKDLQDADGDKAYEDYEPMLLQQHAQRPHLTFPTFDAAMDEFFSKVRFCPNIACSAM